MTYRIRILSLMLMLALGLFLVACGGGEEAAEEAPAPTVAAAEPTAVPPTDVPQPTAVPPTKAPEPTAIPEPTEEPTAEPTEEPAADTDTDPLASILGAQRSYLGVESLRATMTSTESSSGMEFNTVVEFVPPDSYRIVNDFTQMISVGGKTYVTMDGQTWQELPMNMGDMMQGMPTITSDEAELEAYMEEFKVGLTNVDYRGKEELDGRDMKVYEYDSTVNVGMTGTDESLTGHSTLWIGDDDGRVYQVITETKDSNGAVTSVKIVYEYDLDIEIEAPIGN